MHDIQRKELSQSNQYDILAQFFPVQHPYEEALRIHSENQTQVPVKFPLQTVRMHHLAVIFLKHHVNRYILQNQLDTIHNIPLDSSLCSHEEAHLLHC